MSAFPTIEISDPSFTPAGVTTITVKSPALRRRVDLTCYRPAQVPVDQPIPLVILLHGVYGSHWAWMQKGGAHVVLERLMADGEIPPMMLAMPSDGLFGDGSGYLRHADADYATWIVEEVPQAVAEAGLCGDTEGRFITGLSMGGYGALRLGALHPERFRAFSGMSSVTEFSNMERFVAASGHEYRLAPQPPLSLAECLVQQREVLRPFRFDCGSEDILVLENRALHQRFVAEGIPHDYTEHPGRHDWPYWQQHLADQLRFFAAHTSFQPIALGR
jgi:S-formylglutathione hydrolase FrmB